MTGSDEPDWDEETQQCTGGCSGYTALDFAVARGDAKCCRILLRHGATWHFDFPAPDEVSGTGLELICKDENDEAYECAICYDTILLCMARTTACGHKFHKHCLNKLCSQICPLCRCELETV